MDSTSSFDARRLANTPIAIVGMAGLFPQARNAGEYWQNIVDGADCTTEVPADRWRIADYYDPDPTAPDKSYAKRGGFLPDIDFSPIEFGIPPNLLGITSTLQTLSLMVARDVLRDAGVEGSSWYDPARTGVVLGVVGCVGLMHPLAMRLSSPVLREVVRSCGLTDADAEEIADRFAKAFAPWEEDSFPGLLANVTAGRIANRFDLGGMNCTVDAACAASLSAVRMAVAELVDGRADMMITGGADTENSIFTYMCFSKTGALSHSDRVRPFDRSADGTLLGEGIGMLALKRLADAERDGDRIYAVIRGIGSSSDGRAKSIYAPRAEGQDLALRRAYADAGYPISSVELFEAHATGTAVGDRTEIAALTGVLDDFTADRAYAAIGSVKSQIGHTKGAAGAASLMKTALALHHKVLPPTIGVEQANPALDGGPLYLNAAARPWIRDPQRPVRRAGVSAMGFGGTNFHIALQEYGDTVDVPLHRRARVRLFHAPDVAGLIALLRSDRAPSTAPAPPNSPRLAMVVADPAAGDELRTQAADLLEQRSDAAEWSTPNGIYYRARALPEPRVGALFAGQGSQYVGMGSALTLSNPTVRRAFDEAEETFAGSDSRLSTAVFPVTKDSDGEEILRRTEFAQPAIGALSVGQFRVLRELGLECAAYLGHSFGELTALWAAGALDDADYFRLARARGAAMTPAAGTADGGTMAALQCSAERARKLLAEVPEASICNYNAADQIVVGGPTAQVDRLVAICHEAGVKARKLPVSGAFHTSLVAHAVAAFGPEVERTEVREPAGRVHANTAGAAYGADVAANRAILVEHLLQPVDFVGGLTAMIEESRCNILVEFGPKQVLTQLARRTVGADVVTLAVDAGPLGDGDVALRRAVAQLLVLGVDLAVPVEAAPRPPAATGAVVLTGAEYVPDSRRRAYVEAIEKVYVPEPVAAARDAVRAAAEAAPAPRIEPAPLAATADLDSTRQVAEVLTRQTDLHSRYLEGQLRVAEELMTLRRADHRTSDGLAETIAGHSEAISSAHAAANTVLARLAQVGLGADVAESAPPGSSANGLPPNGFVPEAHVSVELPGFPVVVTAPAPAPETDGVAAVTVSPREAPRSPNGLPATGFDTASLRASVLGVVADRTGYSVEMIDPAMDLEADLGVDSIKRVQIVSVLQERHPELPELGPEALAELRTIDQLVDQLTRGVAVSAPAALTTVEPGSLRTSVLGVVADRTGYSVEMIDPAMDLEADLGVDSIKRVQIVSVLQERFPELPVLGPEELAELRTIDQLVERLSGARVAPDGGSPRAVPSPGPAGATTEIPRLPIRAVPLPPVDPAPMPYAERAAVAVVRLGGDAIALSRHRAARNWGVRELVLDTTGEWLGADWDDEALERTLADFFAAGPAPDACVVVFDRPAQVGAAVRRLADALLVVKHAAARAADSGDRAALILVTRIDGRLGEHPDTGGAVRMLGALAALAKTAAAENPSLFTRMLDLHPSIADEAVGAHLLSEMCDAARTPAAVGIDADGTRWTVAPIPDTERVDAGPGLSADDVVLVTGGGRGVTATCAVALARAVPAEYILLGRTDIEQPQPRWADGVADADLVRAMVEDHSRAGATPHPRTVEATCARVRAAREITETLRSIAETGATARYLRADVADAEAVATALAADRDRIGVIVHGAGALSDGLLARESGADIRRVFGPKLAGLAAVLGAVSPATLRRVVLFASVAGVYGNTGQADYAVANEAMSRWPVAGAGLLALAWGAWDGGMVTADLRALFAARGVPLLQPDAAAAAFVAELTEGAGSGEVLLAPPVPLSATVRPTTDAAHIACRDIAALADDPVLDAHRVGTTPVLPAVYAIGWMIAVAESAYPGLRVVAVEDFEVLRGITFEGAEDRRHHVRLDVRSVRDDGASVTASIGDGHPARGASGGGSARYRAVLTLAARTSSRRRAEIDFAAPESGIHFESGDRLYRDGIIFHGPLLQGIRTIHERSADRLTVTCRMPGPVADRGYAGELYHCAPADFVLQAAVVLAAETGTVGWLPLAIDRLDLWAPLPLDDSFVIRVDKVSTAPNRLRVDAEARAASGEVFLRASGITVVTTSGLDEKFRAGVRTWNSTASEAGHVDA
ncbi:type I polyketide synthase [Nocardia arizonensis]|uniref:type I polyketide synthase n=1 Tax=Nocardia arizonensis TaxID=1141647 RepID=UPI0006D03080|nr:type I polyketide synthase [Nocardia arizonensis]